TSVASLEPRADPAETAGENSAAIHEEPVDKPVIDHSPEEIPRHDVGRLHYRAVQRFIDVVLVSHHTLEACLGDCVALARQTRRLEAQHRDHDAHYRNHDRGADESLLRGGGDFRRSSRDSRCGTAHHGIEEMSEYFR